MKIELPCLEQEQGHTCVPACIRIVLHYLGADFSENEISVACKTTPRGTDQDDAAEGIVSLGFNAIKLEAITFEGITRFIRQNQPVIVLLSVKHLPYGSQMGMHAVVVNGFSTNTVSFIDPARGEEIEITMDTFLQAWDERGRLGLVIEV